MSDKIFSLEQRIMDCWNVVDDIGAVYHYIGDNEFFTGMDGEQQDKILNLLLGIKELYAVKFEQCFSDFEDVVRVYHSNRKDLKTISQKHSEDIQENYVKEIMELKEKLRIATNKQVFDDIEPSTGIDPEKWKVGFVDINTLNNDTLNSNNSGSSDQVELVKSAFKIAKDADKASDDRYQYEHIEIDRLMRINPDCTYPQVRILRKCLPMIGVEYSQEKILSGISALIKEDAVADYDEGLAVVKYWLSMESS